MRNTCESLYHHDAMLGQRGIMTPTSSILPSSRVFSQSSRSLLLSESGISGNIPSFIASSSSHIDDFRFYQSHINNIRNVEQFTQEIEDMEEGDHENNLL